MAHTFVPLLLVTSNAIGRLMRQIPRLAELLDWIAWIDNEFPDAWMAHSEPLLEKMCVPDDRARTVNNVLGMALAAL